MAEEHKSIGLTTALIGLVGTILAACGGISGALVTSAVTVFQVQRQNQQVALPASGGGETLSVDTGSIFITRQKAAALDPATYYVNLDQAFVLHRPLPGWDDMEEMTVQDQLAEDNVTCLVVCDQPVFRIRYGEPIEIESDRQTTVNGHLIPEELLKLNEMLYGPPPWKLPYYSQMILNVFEKSEVQALGIHTLKLPYYSQMILNVFEKSEVQALGIHTLPDMILLMTRYSAGRVNRVIAQVDSHFAIVQLSSTYEGIRVGGEPATMTIDNWLLFAEADTAFYTVEIRYTPQSGQPLQVWDDLQLYIDQFRVIQ
ncbi:MAG: hypothetical protein NTW99_09230 [Chloroflexi bacterium]|nr:hypothetical protein [Chloroflexota bacterium]